MEPQPPHPDSFGSSSNVKLYQILLSHFAKRVLLHL